MNTTEQRFHDKVAQANANGCWLWTASTRAKGYGGFWAGDRMVRAHRYAWELANGPIPDGLHVLHKCDTPGCCRPSHLFLGTAADNVADRDAKGRAADQRGIKNPGAKLTAAQAVEVFLATGTQEAIAARLGISRPHVGDIKLRKRWAHATEGLSA